MRPSFSKTNNVPLIQGYCNANGPLQKQYFNEILERFSSNENFVNDLILVLRENQQKILTAQEQIKKLSPSGAGYEELKSRQEI